MTTTITSKRTVKAAAATELLTGAAVLNLLENGKFMDEWQQLYNACAWATVFQSPCFVATWYRAYGKEFLPILIKTEYAGKLIGLFTLVKDKNGLITGAGTNQAEYQVWLGKDADDETFIKNALQELFRAFPKSKVQLKYIPAGVSFGFVKKDAAWNKRCFVKVSPQPLMVIDDIHCTDELRKKNRREKMNRLKRMGALSFERIADYGLFASVFDELALQSDFRKGAMYDKVAFKNDPLRKQFLLDLFEQGQLHATVLKIDDKIIASNVGVCGNNRLHLQGINSFAPCYARYSPGIIHFLLLGKMLAEEGIGVFDLTPGADAYKDMLATEYSEAYTLTIGSNGYGFTKGLQSKLNKLGKKTAAIFGVNHRKLKQAKANFVRNPVSLFNFKLNNPEKTWVIQRPFTGTNFLDIHKDDLSHLISFDFSKSQQEFLADAMHRFEEGGHCYSWAEAGVLLACAWVAKPHSEQDIQVSALYCHPKAREQFSLFLQSLTHTLSAGKIFLTTDYNDHQALKEAGFQQVKNIFYANGN